MKAKRLAVDLLVYRWRYVIGYSIIGLVFLGLIFFAGTTTPGGITVAEQESVVASQHLSFKNWDPNLLIDAPYHQLQQFSIQAFGVSNLSIKLPSLLFALSSAIGLIILLRLWFHRNVAIITSAVVVTTGHFLFVTQNGTADIALVAVAVYMLLFSILIARRSRRTLLWQVCLAITIGLGLYTPFTIYILIALISAALLQPHLRFTFRRTPIPHLLFLSVSTILLAAPLVVGIAQEPSLGLTLLGVPSETIDWVGNIRLIYSQLFNVVTPVSSTVMTPLYGLGSWLLIALGVYRLLTARHTARNYIVMVWLVVIIPILVINPSVTTITFVPFMLLIGFGLEYLIRRWYGLFPKNPYARVAGLIPLGILIVGITYTGIQRYAYGFLYSPDLAASFSYDLKLVNKIADDERRPITMVTHETEKPFYEVVAANSPKISIAKEPNQPRHYKGLVVFTRAAAHSQDRPTTAPVALVTSSLTNDADRLYLYRFNDK